MPEWLLHLLEGLRGGLSALLGVLKIVLPLALWAVWWLFGVDWKKLWPVLARGGWVPLVLLMLIATQAWSQVKPENCDCLGFIILPNFWWQLGYVTMLVLIALFCGWLQLLMRWTPPEYPVNPTPAGHGHAHDNAQVHH